MNKEQIFKRLDLLITHFLFEYLGKSCGIDPINKKCYNMWYGEKKYTANSLKEAFSYPLFDGECIENIFEKVKIIDW